MLGNKHLSYPQILLVQSSQCCYRVNTDQQASYTYWMREQSYCIYIYVSLHSENVLVARDVVN